MIRYELYVHKTLYLSTMDNDEAFRVFRRFTGKGYQVKMKFVRTQLQAVA